VGGQCTGPDRNNRIGPDRNNPSLACGRKREGGNTDRIETTSVWRMNRTSSAISRFHRLPGGQLGWVMWDISPSCQEFRTATIF